MVCFFPPVRIPASPTSSPRIGYVSPASCAGLAGDRYVRVSEAVLANLSGSGRVLQKYGWKPDYVNIQSVKIKRRVRSSEVCGVLNSRDREKILQLKETVKRTS